MLAIAALGGATLNNLSAQQPAWQPQRLPAASTAQPLNQAAAQATGRQPANNTVSGDQEQLGSGVVLRWKSNTSRQLSHGAPGNNQSASPDANPTGLNSSTAFDQSAQSQRQTAFVDNNPLRRASNEMNSAAQQPTAVRFANYQQDVTADPFGDKAPLQLPQQDLPNLPTFPTPGSNQSQPPEIVAPADPLLSPEKAPAPGSVLEQVVPNPFGKRPQADSSASDQFQGELVPRPKAESNQGLSLPRDRQRKAADLLSCDELRDRIRNRPLTDVSLDTSPSFGEGLRSVDMDAEQQRLEFAANSASREWSDNTGRVITRGRLLDLRDDRVVLDVDGSEQTIPLQKLSDVDIAYVGEAWTLPIKCGTGDASYIGRNFIPSAAQWKAPGNCHKPAYFEQPQLERYGHEVGPVLQPILSTAHFFGNIAVLPYKMGIHPPNECQYSLGYFRPGNCAPYMMQPIPLSLRGAAVQAGVMTGAAALIP